MKKVITKIGIFSLILIMLFQSLTPLIIHAQTELIQNDDIKLYQTIEEVMVENGIVLHEGTFIYGEATDDEEFINLQFSDTYFSVSQESLNEVDLTEEELPLFVDVEQIEPEVIQPFNKDQAFYSLYPDEMIRIQLTEDMEYPVHLDELGLEVVYIGNIAYYLNEQDRQIAKDAMDANNPEEIPDPKEDTEDESEENREEEDSSDDLVDEPEKEEPEESIEIEEEESNSVEEELENIEDQKEASSDKFDRNEKSTGALQNADNAWKNSSFSYFKVEVDNLTVYSKGNTQNIGSLTKGQVYPIDANYGNWHQIQFGNTKGYVYKADTSPNDGSSLKNKNNNHKQSKQSFVATQNVTVYDNSSGQLVEFGKINSGERYPIVSEYGKNWSRVIFADRVGYVSNSEVRHEFTGGEKYFTVLVSNLPVYDNRTGSLKQVGSLTKGQSYEIVADYGNWHRIQYNNHYGYVQKSSTEPSDGAYIRNKNTGHNHSDRSFTTLENTIVYDNTGGKLKGFGTIQKGQSYYIQSDYGNWWRIIFADRVGYVQKSKVKQTFVGGEKYFRVLTSDLPIYDNRSGGLKQVGTLTKGQEYEIVSDYGNWHRIQYDNYYGYVLKANTEPSQGKYIKNKSTTMKHGNKVFKALKDVIVYDNKSGALKPFGRIGQGQSYHIASDYGNWWRIIFADRIGYVQKSGVQVIDKNNLGAFMVTEDASVSVLKDGKRLYVATLKKGSIFQKLNEQGNWLEVSLGNQVGYVWKSATQNANYNFKDYSKVGELLTVFDAPLYDNINKSEPIAIIEAGEIVEQTRKVNNHWYEVGIAGRLLYIESDYVVKLGDISFKEENHPYFDILKRYMMNSPFIYDDVNTPENETVEHANLMLNNKIRFPNYNNGEPMDYSNGIDWTKGKNVEPEHQRSFLRQLHGLFFINDLVEAYYITGNESYIIKGYEYIDEWKIANPFHKPKHNMAWHDEGTARRLTTLVNFFEAGKYILNAKEKNELFELMVYHADLLSEDHFYSRNTNHGMFQDEALIVFSKYFYDRKIFSAYYDLAISRMNQYFDSLISSDGVHLEHSPSYHQTIAGSLKSYVEPLNQFGDREVVKLFLDKYNNMAKYATHVIKPDGTWPLIADTYARNRPISTLWRDNPHYQYAVTKGNTGEAPLETNAVFPDAGYAIFRDQWTTPNEGAYIFFTAAYHTSYHKHSDDLSMWIYDGQDIITEAGPHSYTMSDPVTSYAYSSYAHNTLIVDDEGLPRVDGKYDKTYLEDYNLDDPLKPSATGVNNRYNGVTHRRNVVYDKSERIIKVNDSMSSKNKHNYKLLWHLAPGITPVINQKDKTVTLKKDEEELMIIRFSSDQAIKLSSVFGDEDDIYKSSDLDNTKENVMIDVHTLIVEMDNNSGEIQTKFELQGE